MGNHSAEHHRRFGEQVAPNCSPWIHHWFYFK